MNLPNPLFRTTTLLSGIACSLLFSAIPARADVFLAGDLAGIFSADAQANVVNSTDGDASFRTGIATSQSFKSGITFDAEPFTGIGPGETVSLGSLTYFNGITRAGTTSKSAVLDLYLKPADPEVSWLHLGTLRFGIDVTLNTLKGETPDYFTAEYLPADATFLGGEWVQFVLSGIPERKSVAENSKVLINDLTLTRAVAVDESGSSLLLVAVGLICLTLIAGLTKRSAWHVAVG